MPRQFSESKKFYVKVNRNIGMLIISDDEEREEVETLSNQSGGGMGVIFLSLTIILAALIIFITSADYALYSHKKNIISKALDYSVSAAVQEIDYSASRSGFGEGFNEQTGKASIDNLVINEAQADSVFYNTFKANTGVDRAQIEKYALIAITYPEGSTMNYVIKQDTIRCTGSVKKPQELESVINSKIREYYGTESSDKHIVYVNTNPETNMFKMRPYYLVFIKDYKIGGLFKKHEATFVALKGAKIERLGK